ncbi:tellurite resistance protein TehB [Neisseria gonorrhoeae]|uniref:Tellurite resistance protein TehB n=1 Tax=Neisseria gonorrhoeae TaxID=485 RepID=A0A378VU51_NEIGO|nr:tellurite resistance protein TehB [Neisseria gonorrhoeae]
MCCRAMSKSVHRTGRQRFGRRKAAIACLRRSRCFGQTENGRCRNPFVAVLRGGRLFSQKYGMSATHSAVAAAQDTVPAGRALDMGCGQGRNALFLGLKGFDVTAADCNPAALANVAELAEAEGLNVRTLEYDLNAAALQGEFDYIVATVVLMFLMPQRVPDVIADMQAHTAAGGYNLIVSAMDTADFPCPMPFPFKFKEGELKDYYRDWELVEYKEELGAMHAKDENGNPIRFKFVTMLAKNQDKPRRTMPSEPEKAFRRHFYV